MNVIVPIGEIPPDLLEFFEPLDGPPVPDHMAWPSREGGFQGAHYAAYPPDLAAWAIRASCPLYACATCGAGFARVVERRFVPQADVRDPAKLAKGSVKGMAAENGWGEVPRGTIATVTSGWRATCSCKDAGPPVPGAVLDPFCGSGSTLIAADRLGRTGIGIDLNPSYTDLAVSRVTNDAPLLTTVTVAGAAPEPVPAAAERRQLALFGAGGTDTETGI